MEGDEPRPNPQIDVRLRESLRQFGERVLDCIKLEINEAHFVSTYGISKILQIKAVIART